MFRLLGFCLVLIAVCAYCGVAVGVTLNSIMINTSCGWENNLQESNPYGMQIDVMTSDSTVKNIRVLTPAGSIIPTLDLASNHGNDWNYRSPAAYATLSELQAQYKTGTWSVQFLGDGNAIIDSVSLAYNPVAPGGVPIITNSAIDATGVPLTPTFTWDPIVGTGDALSMQVHPIDRDDTYNALMNLSATQWTPGQIDPSTEYVFSIGNYTADGVTVVNGQPQGPTLSTDQGGSFAYLAIAGNENRVNFTTIPEPGTLLLLMLGGVTLICRRYCGIK
jgi:hypothetical protein